MVVSNLCLTEGGDDRGGGGVSNLCLTERGDDGGGSLTGV